MLRKALSSCEVGRRRDEKMSEGPDGEMAGETCREDSRDRSQTQGELPGDKWGR